MPQMNFSKNLTLLGLTVLFLVLFSLFIRTIFQQIKRIKSVTSSELQLSQVESNYSWWQFQAIDTMKISRDESRRYLSNLPKLEILVDKQVKAISETGATHIAIATPYDEEFLPVLQVWVLSARKYNLSVWFRGNWSGWEGWFDYSKIDRATHLSKSQQFIKNHPNLFRDGDVFSACPECENGGPGDPRQTGDVVGHRKFLIDEHTVMAEEFEKLNLLVSTSFNSMNGDVARLVMDKETTQALGGIVVIDHYVKTPEQLEADIKNIALRSGGKVVLGEIGVSIPDIHGNMSEAQKAQWLESSFQRLATLPELIGVSYWTNIGGSTAIWSKDVEPTKSVSVLTKYFKPKVLIGEVTSNTGKPIKNAVVSTYFREVSTTEDGMFAVPVLSDGEVVTVRKQEYHPATVSAQDVFKAPRIALLSEKNSVFGSFWQFLLGIFQK